MTHITVMKQALILIKAQQEWIQAVPKDPPLPAMPGFDGDWADDVVGSLRAAIAQGESEPAKEVRFGTDAQRMALLESGLHKEFRASPTFRSAAPVGYVPLSEDQIKAIQYSDPAFMTCSCVTFARAIERAVRGIS